MTRINTNVSSLLAQQSLANANNEMQTSLTRLSTGLQINSGADNPSGLIAANALGSQIVGTNTAITNSQTAEQMVSTADSALSQIGTLLDSIRGLVSASANSGTESSSQIAANQQQVDSSLQAIDQIAQTTQFNGQNLLDGSLNFTTANVNSAAISGVTVNQATIPTTGPLNVTAQLTTQATQAQLNYQQGTLSNATVLNIGGANGTQSFNFAAGTTIQQIAAAVQAVSGSLGVTATATQPVSETAQQGVVNVQNAATGADLQLTANNAGAALGNVHVNLVTASNPSQISATAQVTSVVAGTNGSPATINVQLGQTAYQQAAWSGGAAGSDYFDIQARNAGSQYNGYTVSVVNGGAASAAINTNAKTITLTIQGGTTTEAGTLAAWNSNTQLNSLFALNQGANYTAGTTVTNGMVTSITNAMTANAGNPTTLGVDGGAVINGGTNDVTNIASLINANSTANMLVTAAPAGGSDGTKGLVATSDSVNYNTAVTNGALQITGPENSPNVQFVNGGASQAFSVNLSNAAGTYGNATATIQSGTATDGFLQLTAKTAGVDNGATVQYVQDTNFGASTVANYNAGTNTLTFRGNFNAGDVSLSSMASAVNSDANGLGNLFTASVVGTGAADVTGGVHTVSAGGQTAATMAGGGLQTAGSIVVNLATDATGAVTTTAADVANYFNNTSANPALAALGMAVNAGYNPDGTLSSGAGLMTATAAGQSVQLTDNSTQISTGTASKAVTAAANGVNASLTVTALQNNPGLDGIQVQLVQGAAAAPDSAVYSAANKTVTISYANAGESANTLISNLKAATDSGTKAFLATFGIAATGTGASNVSSSDVGYTSGGTTTSGAGVAAQRNWDKGTPTGTGAELQFTSLGYGSAANVSVNAVSGTFNTVNGSNKAATTANGTDVVATINGMQAVGNGLNATVMSDSLSLGLNFNANATAGTTTAFEITGGGALFQIGANVTANEQVRLGIQSASTTSLGGTDGLLYQLGSGQSASLTANPDTAASIVNDATNQVSSMRAQLGAFDATTLQTNINTLNGTVLSLTAAQSNIQDADFAAESANFTRAQILVQSATSVLSVANQNPQNVLALLKNM